MGLFDTINVKMKCPYCGKIQIFDAQTKDMECCMNTYNSTSINNKSKKDDNLNQLNFVNVIADCHSDKCQAFADKEDIKSQGMPSGFGRQFKGKIKIKNGRFVGKIYDIKKKVTE